MYEVKRRKSKVKFYVKIFNSKTGKSQVNCNIKTQTYVVTEKSDSGPKLEPKV